MLDFQLVAHHFCVNGAVAGLAGKGVPGAEAELVREHDAAIEGDVLLGVLELVSDAGRVGYIPGHRRVQPDFFDLDGIPEALGIFVKAHQSKADRFVRPDRGLHICLHAVLIPATDGAADFAPGLKLRPLGDQVNRAARLAAAEQRRSGAPEYFDRFDADQIPRASEAAAGIEAVHEKPAGQVDIAGKPADREAVPQPAEIVLACDRRRQVEGVVQVQGADLSKQRFIHDLDGRRVLQLVNVALIGAAITHNENLFDAGLVCVRGRFGTRRQRGCGRHSSGQRERCRPQVWFGHYSIYIRSTTANDEHARMHERPGREERARRALD